MWKESEKMNEMLSVIIPVYNAEKYLDRCVSSVLNQTYGNLEVILVDDGSTDNSPKICDLWKERDHRVRVMHKDNAGPGAARNKGVEISRGGVYNICR